MVIIMEDNATEQQVQIVTDKIKALGFEVHRSDGKERTVLGAVGEKRGIDKRDLELLAGVREVVAITKAYKLASREFHHEDTILQIGDVKIGGDNIVIMAGPCAVESKELLFTTAELLVKNGAQIIRGGAFKPRTSPYSFQGLGEEGLKYLREAGDKYKLAVVSEVMDVSQIKMMLNYVDIFQVGARNMQNFWLLKELGKIRKPILLKRGMSATIEEWLMAAEYIMSGGNYQVILCERGIRTFENYTRNTLDLSAIPVIQKLSHLPVIVDPSHATGRRDKVLPMARASIAAGAHGLMIEIHPKPDQALSDGAQSLYPDQFSELMDELRIIAKAVKKTI
ncbi:3-deoxy-7-phosphoheptulonate synthase [candidate division KSB1 bacterium]|nr:3-deoxy-7-phosphoheptulonate synthase [candidate division KSB1 bacterium]MBL7092665.1 3-deoxy-7-phosphoheptulonate synthase [candidate division KSB1 bacterium]